MTTFEPPAPGAWQSFSEHFPDAMPRLYQRLISTTLTDGMRAGFARYGMPAESVELKFVHGHAYLHPVPLIDSGGRALPPAPILWIAARVHPKFRRREKVARRALAARLWLEDTRRWFEAQRPEWLSRNRALQATELPPLDDDALRSHVVECYDNLTDGYQLHFELHTPDMLPAGMLLARAADWGLDHRVLNAALVGASPVSRGEHELLEQLRTLVQNAGAAPATLDDIRAIGPEASKALDEYLADYGGRMVSSYDPTGATFGELPALVLQRIVTPARPAIDAELADGARDELRTAVPEADRAEFDRLLEDVRATCELRDDNGQLTGSWPMGLLRRALLECGRRLATRGALHDEAHVMDLDIEEIVALLRGETGPAPQEVASRAAERAANSALVPPDTLGPPEPAPPFSALPRGLATLGRALLATVDGLATPPSDLADALYGSGIGREPYRGRAIVARQPEEAIERLEPGDVLVAVFTTPAYNAVLPLAGALVVEAGGILSHAAVMARELDLPAVIGAAGAMATIKDGDIVEVDPVAGRVRVLEATPAH